jgi:hypothetical protein
MSLASLILSSLCVAGAELAYTSGGQRGGAAKSQRRVYEHGVLLLYILYSIRELFGISMLEQNNVPTFSLGLNYNS